MNKETDTVAMEAAIQAPAINQDVTNDESSEARAAADVQQGSGENDSSSSSNGRGSGGGYNADCSSTSDASSESSTKRKRDDPSPNLADSVDKLALCERKISGADFKSNCNFSSRKETVASHVRSRRAKHRRRMASSPLDGDAASVDSSSGRSSTAAHIARQIGELNEILEQNRQLLEHKTLHQDRNEAALPQWNGVRIEHPMDPRIDLSNVDHLPSSSIPLVANNMHHQPALNQAQDPSNLPPLSLDSYRSLMEAVRPFFLSFGWPPMPPPPPMNQPPMEGQQEENADEPNVGTQSSEGFTAFFTTTSDSNSDKKPQHNSDGANSSPQQHAQVGEDPPQNASPDESDTSSMVVLARVKRKHMRTQQAEGHESSSSISHQRSGEGSGSNEGNDDENEANDENDSNEGAVAQRDDLEQAVGVHQAMHILQQALEHEEENAIEAQPAQIVTESSSGANTATNTSGSASGGNSGSNSGTNSGSGSNQGSSGSGNENQASSGSGNEGKGSSDEAVKYENVGGDGNSNSDENNNMAAKAMEVDEMETIESRKRPDSPEDDDASREKKLLNKKRKRMNMRREYEEQVQQDLGSSESSSQEELILRPGKPVTLDAVLSFTKVARVVVQATPPFLVVHANAAYSALTGIDSHSIIGKPVRRVLQIPEAKDRIFFAEVNNEGSQSGQSSMTNSNVLSRQPGAASDAEAQHLVEMNNVLDQAAAVGQGRALSSEIMDMNVERIIAASGFGHIHIMNAVSKPHQMLGRNVMFLKPADASEERPTEVPYVGARESSEVGSQEGSSSVQSSTDAPVHVISCRMSVSPVVSSTSVADQLAVVTDQEKSGKRRKHHHYYHHYRRHPRNNLVTHYVIQLEKAVASSPATKPPRSQESVSSNSKSNSTRGKQQAAAATAVAAAAAAAAAAEAEQAQAHDHNMEAEEEEDEAGDDDASEATDPKQPVSTIG